MKLILSLFVLLASVQTKVIPNSVTWDKICSTDPELPVVGKIKTAEPDPEGHFSLCCACEDRDFANFSQYKPYLRALLRAFPRDQRMGKD